MRRRRQRLLTHQRSVVEILPASDVVLVQHSQHRHEFVTLQVQVQISMAWGQGAWHPRKRTRRLWQGWEGVPRVSLQPQHTDMAVPSVTRATHARIPTLQGHIGTVGSSFLHAPLPCKSQPLCIWRLAPHPPSHICSPPVYVSTVLSEMRGSPQLAQQEHCSHPPSSPPVPGA
jgi:hypothetical protein